MIVIKLGGEMIRDLSHQFFEQLKQWQANQEQIILLHGGGNLISTCSEFIGQATHKIDGIRITNEQTMQMSETILNKIIQSGLTKQLLDHQILAKSLNQGGHKPLIGEMIDPKKFGQVGVVQQIKSDDFQKNKANPVLICSSIAISEQGKLFNVNADSAAGKLAELLHADQLYLLTDVKGVYQNQEVLETIDLATANQLIQEKIIKDGMIPKLKAAFSAAEHQIKQTYQINWSILVQPSLIIKKEF